MGVDMALMSDRFGSIGACGIPPRRSDANASEPGSITFNSGFFMLKPGPAALWLWSEVQQYHTKHPQVMQQAALNAVAQRMSGQQQHLRLED